MKPLFNWLDTRSAGILMHITSLPGHTGIGTLGKEAIEFVHLLSDAGLKHWQICPLGPTGFGDSPYQSFSSYAGNPYLIDLETLLAVGLLTEAELKPLRDLPEKSVDYGAQWSLRWPLLRLLAGRFLEQKHEVKAYKAFCKSKELWLKPFTMFMALKHFFNGAPWYQWGDIYRVYSDVKESSLPEAVLAEMEIQSVLQYLFFSQWDQLRAYALEHKVEIIGDLPIFVAMDSADVWAAPEVFQLNDQMQPKAVAGVPPDYFSPEGQLWGNPLYDWNYLEKTNFQWWIDRVHACMALYDIVRIDHFRGFDAFWRVPADAPTAKTGEWIKAPGLALFKAIRKNLPEARFIAEDLGVVDDSMIELREATGLPGMAVLQFAFDGENSDYLPHNQRANCILYPGTHDNNTTLGWYAELDEPIRHRLREYLRISGDTIGWDFIRSGYASVCRLFIMPLQDLLNLRSDGRMNTPGVPNGNWCWRATHDQLDRLRYESMSYIRDLGRIYYR